MRQRNKIDIRNPDAILTADWHLRDDRPIARTDDYWSAQELKVAFVSGLQQKHGCPVLHAGDLFHKHSPSPYLLQWVIKHLPKSFVTVPGNHDIPNHNMDRYESSGLAVLEAAGVVKVLREDGTGNWDGFNHSTVIGFPYGAELYKNSAEMIMLHEMVFNKPPFPGVIGYTPDDLREIFPDAKLISTGHNHTPLFDNTAEPLVLNPGSLMRMTADQTDYEPCVWLWYAKENRVEPIKIPIEKGIICRKHIDAPEERDERMLTFVERLRTDIEIGLSFKNNLEAYMKKNKVPRLVDKTVWEAVG